MGERQPVFPRGAVESRNPLYVYDPPLPSAPPAYDDITTGNHSNAQNSHPPPYSSMAYSASSQSLSDEIQVVPNQNERQHLIASPSAASLDDEPPWTSYYGDRLPHPNPSHQRWLQSAASEPTDAPVASHKPLFAYLISVVDIALIIFECISGGIVDIKFKPEVEVRSVSQFGYKGSSSHRSYAARYTDSNMFIGPSVQFLVHHGAKFVPCMRDDTEWKHRMLQKDKEEITFRCCGLNYECGMLDETRCLNINGSILQQSDCRQRYSSNMCVNGITVKPCCVGVLGQCSITTQDNCTFHKGYWHDDKILCGETNCLNDACGMTEISSRSEANQWFRFIIPIFLHVGIIHMVLNVLVQFFLCKELEKYIGFVRIALIYLASGIGGNIVCGLLNPTVPQVGASGAIFGLMALQVVKLFRHWRYTPKPCCDLLVLITVIVICFGFGTLPYVSNYVHVGGFVFGFIASVLFVPSVRLDHTGHSQGGCVKRLALFLLLAMFVASLVAFYNIQNTEWCVGCHYLDCIPWTTGLCPYSTERGIFT